MSVTPIPLRVKIDSLLHRAMFYTLDQAVGTSPRASGIFCGICKCLIQPGEAVDWDHHLPENAGGTNDYTNVRPLHRECHKRKTFRPRSKATTLCGDNFEAKKAGRIARGGKKIKKPMGPSRGFDKTKTRKLSGEVVTR